MRWTRPRLLDLLNRLDAAYPEARCALDHQDPFQLVVATILSAQCTDARVNLTTPALFARYSDAAALGMADPEELEALIRPTGFFRNKARNLIGLGQALEARHGGQVPSDPAALAALPGVGQKTANVVLANAFGVPALAVDTHIFRVARRLGLSEAPTPEKVEADLTRQFPRDRWIPLHHQLIWHGRRVCAARKPACLDCPIQNLCPTGSGRIPDPHTGAPVEISSTPATPAVSAPGAVGPQRIVSLVPSLTELLVQWGLADRLVGRTRYCIEPRWIRATVPAVGGTKDPDLEALRALKPDLVILERDENTREAAEALAAAGIPLLVLSVRNLRDTAAAWERLGEALGVPEVARARAEALRGRLARKLPRRKPKALALVWRDPWVAAGPDTCIGDLLRVSGFAPLGLDGYPRLDDAALQALAPDLVLLPSEPYRFTARHAAEVARLLPSARVERVDGQALAWCLSRPEAGLELMEKLKNQMIHHGDTENTEINDKA